MKTITKKKLYHGMYELRDYEVEKLVKLGRPVKLVLERPNMPLEYMVLHKAELKKGIVNNTQKSIFNGKNYLLVGYRWHGKLLDVEESPQISMNVWERLAKDRERMGI